MEKNDSTMELSLARVICPSGGTAAGISILTSQSGCVGHRPHVQTYARLRLQQPDDTEQVLGRGIARRTEHAHQTLRRSAERGAEFFETDCSVNARAQRGAPLIQITIEQRLHRLSEQCPSEFDVATSP